MDVLLLQIFNSLSVSSILLLIALGLAITFGLMNVINMAHGELIMIGAYVTYVVQILFERYVPGSLDFYYLVAIPLSFLVSAFFGFLLERGLIRFLYGRPLDTLLATWGISLIFQQIARDIFGAPNVEVKTPSWLKGGVEVMSGLQLPLNRLFIIALAIVCLVGIYVYMYHSAAGCRMRAVMQNRAMASCLGIPAGKIDAYTFAIGSGLAGVAGCALCLLGPIGPSIGTYYIVDAFMVVVLGGVGKLIGTVAAAGVIGVLNTTFEFGSTATMGKVLALVMVIAFLHWKPSGLVSLKVRTLD
ncbi:urea ABC transporter permease subunit UrtB [Calderihabitans maritimus]|uniref:Urea ABC transporter permease UrtB n=1 Tax=Calderihabitans maritimus TaxID=1246530 RepID=A0A1Z5HTE7_9FIRM|nr:urea ABC transporter permease subunit UrtB [Calderihabitans maritimus]GAW92794.1 urea ABC transporter permease UrtB [Calderihabitans maritimus]